ncbi:helix-turn-helix transcriptional regulator [Microtetraspora fusca]|uniref:Helix-turn-helix transcriptional regulator n=1 Tax=Microtetraspora fusca TaxID=1997 RepID=A0ABW6VII6_MICFU
MYVDILILSHLLKGPIHGYELKRGVAETTGYTLHNNSLYPALRRFEESGAVVKTAEPQEGRPPRHIYTITELGRELLYDMLGELPPELAGDEEEFLTRVGLFSLIGPDERRAVLAARGRALAERERHLLHQAGRASGSDRHHDWGGLVVTELLDRVRRERTWIERLTERA